MDTALSHFRAAPSWRRISIVVGAVAAVELVLLVIAGVSLLAKPVQSSVKRAALEQVAAAPAAQAAAAVRVKAAHVRALAAKQAAAARRAAAAKTAAKAATTVPVASPAGIPKLPRAHTAILVLNGIGTPGAAGRTAARVEAKGYRIDGVTNAARSDYKRTTIMYRPGFRAEAARLGKDLRVKLVGPLDGMHSADLGRAQLVVIVGK